MSPNYVRRYVAEHGLTAPQRTVAQCLLARARRVLRDAAPAVRGHARVADARRLPYGPTSVELILTSPPYFSVHRYARDNWLRLWFLGYSDYRTIQRRLLQTSDVNRYRAQMRLAFTEMKRLLVPGGRALVFVGDVTLRRRHGRKTVKTAHLLAKDAAGVGLTCDGIVQDTIPRKYKVAGYMALKGGISTERLLILRKPSRRQETR